MELVGAAQQGRIAAGGTAPPVRVIAVASGKGGVGKTQLVANLAVYYAREGLRVLALDGDLGLANLDLALGIEPRQSMLDLISGDALIGDVLAEGPEGMRLLAGCSGRYDLANLGTVERRTLFSAVDTLEDEFDVLLIDTGAGVGTNAVDFAAAAETVVVVASAEPTSIADAYGFIKVMHSRCGNRRFHVVANMVRSTQEGEEVYGRLSDLAGRFLGVGVTYLGSVLQDLSVQRAVRRRTPVLLSDPQSTASLCIEGVAKKLSRHSLTEISPGGIRLFWKRLAGWRTAA